MIRKKTSMSRNRRRGVAAILAMMFLVIFGSLAAAMAIVSQGNLTTADSHMKMNRSLAAAETGLRMMTFRLEKAAALTTTRDGMITTDNAEDLWEETRDLLLADLNSDWQYQQGNAAKIVDGRLEVGLLAVGSDGSGFRAVLMPHPIAGEDYDSAYYQREPYDTMDTPVSSAAPLDNTWIRMQIIGLDGPGNEGDDGRISRTLQIDFKMDKRIPYAILSRSRVMIGRNVIVDGPIGSTFTETHLKNGHPIQMASDFLGMNSTLDAQIENLYTILVAKDIDGDNRLACGTSEVDGLFSEDEDQDDYDLNGDNYIDEYDYFLGHYDANADGEVTALELDARSEGNPTGNINTAQFLEMVDTFGPSDRPGYDDGIINAYDRYVKIRGEVHLKAKRVGGDGEVGWVDGAIAIDGGTAYQDEFKGPIIPSYTESAITFESDDSDNYQFVPSDFNVSTFKAMTTDDFKAQAAAEALKHDADDPTSPQPLYDEDGNPVTAFEPVPFGAAYAYDYFNRPVYENMTFTNVRIPKGTNALFKNCTFIGVTFVETETNNTDTNFNYAGMYDANGDPMYPDHTATVSGSEIVDTKTVSNNLRFHSCTFNGSIVTDAPTEYTHTRNKLAFTGQTRFDINNAPVSESEKELFRRSTILAPHYSLELGTFVSPFDSNETTHLSGTIVAGLLDMRGQVKINGTVLTTFSPVSNSGPVLGETSPQFNTTLGYFNKSAGDLESEMPNNGVGVIQVRYDPTMGLPDGILGPIMFDPVVASYYEGKSN